MTSSGRLGTYEILSTLAVGGMAEVFLARLVTIEGFEKRLVVKRILPHLSSDKRFIELFLDEARLAAKLTHPNIVQIFELGQQDGDYFIAMEYVDGHNLNTVLKRSKELGRRIPIEHAVRAMCAVCEALAYAHAKRDDAGKPLGIVHRDVSPSNVLVSFDGVVKLIDFGIAKSYARLAKTRPGVVLGKAGYSSPEQVKGLPVDARSDVFSCGAVLYDALCGERPFAGFTDIEQMQSIVERDPTDPRRHMPDLPDEIVRILLKAMAKDPARRYDGAQALQIDLERFLASQGLVSTTSMLASFMRELFEDELRGAPVEPEEPTKSRVVVAAAPSEAGDSGAFAEARTVLEVPRLPRVRTIPSDEPIEATVLAPAPDEPPRRRAGTMVLGGLVGLVVVGGAAFAMAGGESEESRVVEKRGEARAGPEADSDPEAEPDSEPEAEADPDREPEADSEAAREAAREAEPEAEAEAEADREGDADAARVAAQAAVRPRSPAREGSRRRRAPVERRRAAEPVGEGFLTINTTPWSEVFLQGKSLGLTPIAAAPVPAGRHALTLVNGERGLKRTVIVAIEDGETARVSLKLDDPG